MNRSKDILAFLDHLGVSYTLFEHEPKLSIEACQTTPGVDWVQSAMCKNIFLCNRQESDFYLMLLRYDRPFRTAVISKLLGASRLSFARPELLTDMLKLDPGAVNPLSLIFDSNKRIQLAIDQDLQYYKHLLFHPGVNDMSLSMKCDDFIKVFLPACGHHPKILNLQQN